MRPLESAGPELPTANGFHFGVVLLAAGASIRMGQPKLLLPWGSTSILGHLIALWEQLGAGQLGIVGAAADSRIVAELERIDSSKVVRIVNDSPELGMFSSIQVAARWNGWSRTITHWTIVLGDQPHIPIETLRQLLEFGNAHPERICQPSRLGRPRHPVLLPRARFHELSNSRAETLKAFLQQIDSPVLHCEIDDPALDLDLDTPADYTRALRMFPVL